MIPRNIDIGFFCKIRKSTVRDTEAKRQADKRAQHRQDGSFNRTVISSGQFFEASNSKSLYELLPLSRPNAVFGRGMAASRAISQIADGCGPMGATRFKVTGMATGAIGLVGGRTPCHRRTVSTMAVRAIEIDAVIARVGSPRMVKARARPVICAVATVA